MRALEAVVKDMGAQVVVSIPMEREKGVRRALLRRLRGISSVYLNT